MHRPSPLLRWQWQRLSLARYVLVNATHARARGGKANAQSGAEGAHRFISAAMIMPPHSVLRIRPRRPGARKPLGPDRHRDRTCLNTTGASQGGAPPPHPRLTPGTRARPGVQSDAFEADRTWLPVPSPCCSIRKRAPTFSIQIPFCDTISIQIPTFLFPS